MRIERNLTLMKRYTVCTNAMFIVAVVIPYYAQAMGLSFQDFLIAEACYAATVVIMEVPMGWLSDQWLRKHTLALGSAVQTLGYVCLFGASLFGNGLFWAILGQSIIGVGLSMISGTNIAMIYDSLLSVERTQEYRRHEGSRSATAFYSVAVASLLSGLLYKIDIHLPLIMTIAFSAASVVFAVMMDEPERHRVRPEKHPLADMAATAHYALRGHREVGLIILFAAALFCSTKLIMWSQQPYFMAVGLDESWFGVLMAGGFMLAGISSHLAHRLDGKIGNLPMLAFTWCIALTVTITTGIHQNLIGVALLMIGGSCLYALANPRVSEAINRRVDSSRRATILSTQGLMTSLFFIPTSLAVGAVNDTLGIGGGLLAIAGWLAVAGILLSLLLINKDRRKRLIML